MVDASLFSRLRYLIARLIAVAWRRGRLSVGLLAAVDGLALLWSESRLKCEWLACLLGIVEFL